MPVSLELIVYSAPWSPRHLPRDSVYSSVPLQSLSQPFRQSWYLTMLINVGLIHCMSSFVYFSASPVELWVTWDCELNLKFMLLYTVCSMVCMACRHQVNDWESEHVDGFPWGGKALERCHIAHGMSLQHLWLAVSRLTCDDFAWLFPVRYVLWDHSYRI